MGPKSATIPVYAAESVPEKIRGGLVMQWQTWTAAGIMMGFASGLMLEPAQVVPRRALPDKRAFDSTRIGRELATDAWKRGKQRSYATSGDLQLNPQDGDSIHTLLPRLFPAGVSTMACTESTVCKD